MGTNDKADAQKDQLAGKVKEGVGKLTGNEKAEAEGKGQSMKGKASEGVNDAKDKAKGFVDGMKKD